MASPETTLPLDFEAQKYEPAVEPENESPVATEHLDTEHPPVAKVSNTAASSTGSTPAPVAALELPPQQLNEAKEAVAFSQKPPKITPRGVRRIKPLRQKEGVYIQPWDFNFEALSKLKLSHDNEGKHDKGKKHPVPAAKKKGTAIHRTQSASSTLATLKLLESPNGSNSTEVESSPGASTATNQQAPHRRQHGKLHTTRVEFLLKKYLQDPSDVLVNVQEQVNLAGKAGLVNEDGISTTADTTIPTLPSPRLQRPQQNFQKRATKSIMQVKGEQDAAVRALQHAPRQFHSKPMPLEVAAPRLDKPATTENILISTNKSSTEQTYINLSPRGSISAKPVPPSTTEPRYALLVADSVLRRYSAGNVTNEENDTNAGSNSDNNNNTSGLQKWLSWPAGQGENGESAVHLQTVGSPHRPQSARPRRRSQSPAVSHHPLPDIAEEVPEQLKEFY